MSAWPTAPTGTKINTTCSPQGGAWDNDDSLDKGRSPIISPPSTTQTSDHIVSTYFLIIQSRNMHNSGAFVQFLGLGLLVSLSFANPMGGTSLSYERWARSLAASDTLAKRSSKPYPSKADCESNAKTPGESKSLFFSGVGRGGDVWDGLLEYKNDNSLLLVNDIYTPNPGFCEAETPSDESSSEYRTFSDNFCAVFAEKSSGTAFVGIPKDCDPKPDSTWKTIEFSSLTANADVTKIIRFDPTSTALTTTIYPVNAAATATGTLSACSLDDYFYNPDPSSTSTSSTSSAKASTASATASIAPQAEPACSTDDTVATSDAQTIQATLAGTSGNTCVSSAVCASLGTHGTATISLCSTNSAKQCVTNADLAIVVKDIIIDCTKNDLIAGSATIPSATGLKVTISINDTT